MQHARVHAHEGRSLLEQALGDLADEMADDGKGEAFEMLKVYLTAGADGPPYDEVFPADVPVEDVAKKVGTPARKVAASAEDDAKSA